MSQKITADYETQFLFPRSLEDWVGGDDPARYIREFVRQLPLDELKDEEELAGARDVQGRPHYSFELLLSVWLYGYANGIRSARKLERGCRELMPLIWLAGTHEPDHNTLWRFWNRYRSVLREVFTQSVKVAWEAKLIGMVMHAVDGTKIASAGSRRSGWHREDLDRVLEAVGKRIDRLEKEIETGRAEGIEIDDRLPEDLQKQTALRETIRAALDHLNEEKQNHLHPNDPDARMMVNGQGRTEFSYNAQAVADEQSGVIVAADVTTEANDARQLAPMIDQVQENLGTNADATVADSGYDTAEGLGHAERRGAQVIVHSRQRLEKAGPYHTARFTYDNERDVVCPRGEHLRLIGMTRHRDKPYPVQRYRCELLSCPVRKDCSRDPKGRVVEISPHHGAVMRNRQRLAEPSSRDALRKRGATIERIFAEIKHVMGFRRWTVAGKEKVQAQWWMICTAINLRRLIHA